MPERIFVDTNVLVYARDATEPDRGARARQWMEGLWRTRQGRLNYQVLNEYFVTVTQKLDPGLPVAAAREDVRLLESWRPGVVDAAVMEGAFAAQDGFSLSWWDALIVSAAEIQRCGVLLTEDLQDGQRLHDLVVLDPFQHAPGEVLG